MKKFLIIECWDNKKHSPERFNMRESGRDKIPVLIAFYKKWIEKRVFKTSKR